MKKQIGIFLAGMLIVVPFALTIYVAWSAGTWVNGLGNSIAQYYWKVELPVGVGAVLILVAIYLVGLLTQFWVFRGLVGLLERLVSRLPGIKTIYESTRDLMKLFGGESRRMGRSVLYRPPGSGITMLAILTNDNPRGIPPDALGKRVALYVPYSYMFGGLTIYVPPEHVEAIDLPVEQVLKLAATAQVTPGREQARTAKGQDAPPGPGD